MSDAPRTDARELDSASCNTGLHAHYGWKMARTLERELTAVSAEITRLRAELAERDAEVARLNALFVAAVDVADEHRARADQPRTDAEWKAADRKKRINDLAARYAGQLMAGDIAANNGWKSPGSIAADARALAVAVVEAEE